MCLAIPMRLLERRGDLGIVELAGVRREVHLGLVPDLAPGDYVLVHAGFVIEKLDPERAEENLRLFRTILSDEPDESGPSS